MVNRVTCSKKPRIIETIEVMEEQQKDVDRRQLADTEQINEINWSNSTVVWDNKERYNNIDD